MALTDAQKAKKAISMKLWKQKNKEHVTKYKKTIGKEKNAEYRERNREKLREKSRAYYAKNREEIRRKAQQALSKIPTDVKKKLAAERYLKEKEKHDRYTKTYREANPKKISAIGAAWKKKNAHKVRAYSMKRIAAKKRAIPKWADLELINDVYKEAEYMQLEVDHIVPLTSKIVCGLHVWDNLQLLPKRENIIKGNRYWPDMPCPA